MLHAFSVRGEVFWGGRRACSPGILPGLRCCSPLGSAASRPHIPPRQRRGTCQPGENPREWRRPPGPPTFPLANGEAHASPGRIPGSGRRSPPRQRRGTCQPGEHPRVGSSVSPSPTARHMPARGGSPGMAAPPQKKRRLFSHAERVQHLPPHLRSRGVPSRLWMARSSGLAAAQARARCSISTTKNANPNASPRVSRIP